ncbi:hypothetical protein [Microbacterium paraoxydans]|jgi:hypothetical protein|uniref:hypothetical protein n=1 Tax=Microbacterium paraoxydans TaxID=199592 RepID=UPI003D7409C0
MSVAVTDGPTTVAGATVVEARALHRLAVGIVRDVVRVGAGDVSVQLADRRGDLRVSVEVPVVRGRRGADTVGARADAVRDAVVGGMRDLAARRVGAVDVRFTGVRREDGRRVA